MEEFPNYMAFNPENHQLCHSTTLQCGRKNYPLCRCWGRWLGCDLAAGHRLVPRTMQRLFLLPSWRRRPSSAPPLSNSRSGFHGQTRSNSLLSPSQEKKNLESYIYIASLLQYIFPSVCNGENTPRVRRRPASGGRGSWRCAWWWFAR